MTSLQFISCIRFSMQLIMAEGIFVTGWKKRQGFLWRLFAGFLGYGLLAFVTFHLLKQVPTENPLILVFYYLCLFFYSLGWMKCCFDVKLVELLFAGICGYATQHIAFALKTAFFEVTGLSFTGFLDFLLVHFLPYVLTDLFIYVFVVKKNTGKGELKERDIRMLWLASAILCTVIVLSCLVDNQVMRQDAPLLQNVFCKIYAAVCSILAIFIAFFLSRQNRILQENERMESMLRTMGEQQRLSKEAVSIINIKCHDLKYRISQIAKIQNTEEQQEYIEEVKGALSIYDNIFQTGNEALDLVLTEKSLLCSEHEIKMSSMVDGKSLHFISSTDLYALFGNLLDNAIESVQKEADKEKRIISLQVSRRSQGVYIHMENFCGEPVEFADDLPLTTKADKAYHGFGVRSIKYIVEKYRGDLLMRAQEQRFLVDILFYPEK